MAATLLLAVRCFSLPSMDLHFPLCPLLLKPPRDGVTVKPPLPASGPRAFTSFQELSLEGGEHTSRKLLRGLAISLPDV